MTDRLINALFDLNDFNGASPWLRLLRKHDIQTHHNENEDYPWVAIPMKAARYQLSGEYDEEGPKTIEDLDASQFCTLESEGLICDGQTKEEVQIAALKVAMNRD